MAPSLAHLVAALAMAPGFTGGSASQGRYVTVDIGPAKCDVTQFGARGDGTSDDTRAIQAAMDHCGSQGGGTVTVPAPGRYLIFSIAFTASHLELHIATGAVLTASNNMSAWANGTVGSAIIVANGKGKSAPCGGGCQHIAITGGGIVEGNGMVWWQARGPNGNDDKLFRPHTVDFKGVTHALLSDTLYQNSPSHVLELYCNDCEVSGVRVLNPPSTGDCKKINTCSHNTDAVDVHGEPFYIHSVNFTTGDDNVAGHANHTLVEDSYFGTGHGVSIGSLCDDWVRNFTVRNCSFFQTTAGARIKAHAGCNGRVWQVSYSNLTMRDVVQPIVLSQFYSVSASTTARHGAATTANVTAGASVWGDDLSFKPKAPMRFSVNFSDIVSVGGGKKGTDVVDMKCATTAAPAHDPMHDSSRGSGQTEQHQDLCSVNFHNVRFTGLDSSKAKQNGMVCTGVQGSAQGLSGVNNCMDVSQACSAALGSLCSAAKKSSSGDCFVCCGTHQAQLQSAGCSEAALDAFCSS